MTIFRLVCADGSDHLHEVRGTPITHADEQHLAEVGDYMDEPRPETLWDCGPHRAVAVEDERDT